MKWLAMLIVCLTAVISPRAQQAIARDSAGLVVEVKEKYGGLVVDTATVVMYHDGQFVLVKRDGATAWFPASFHSIRIIGRVGTDAGREHDGAGGAGGIRVDSVCSDDVLDSL